MAREPKPTSAKIRIFGETVTVLFDAECYESTLSQTERNAEAKRAILDLISSVSQSQPSAMVRFEFRD